MAVSPPTRGWSLDQLEAEQNATGFPAHAGMVLRQPLLPCVADRFPRPRGSHISPCSLNLWLGFPAHAGMVPQPRRGAVSMSRFPRPRGDGPLPEDIAARFPTCRATIRMRGERQSG